MALLGIQAEMQCEGNIPVPRHYSNWNLNVNTNGGAWLLNDVDNIFKNRNYHNGALLLPSPDQHSVQSKEVVKQTMLKQEAIFRDQISELHRIYWRQRELMDEMKKNELLKHHLQQGTLQSNPFSPQDLCDDVQRTSHVFSLPGVNPALNQSSISTAKNDPSLSHFDDGKFVQSGSDPAQTKFSLKGCELESSKKFGKLVLDLELPPTEYIDSEDEESLQKVPEVTDHPMNRISEAVHKSDWQPDHGSGGFNSVFQEDNLNPGSLSSKRKFLADLNEPIKLEEGSGTMSMYLPDLNEPNKNEGKVAAASKFLDLNEPVELLEEAALPSEFPSSLARHTDFSCQDLAQKGIQVPPTDITHNKTGRDSETCSSDLHLEKYDDDAGQRRSNVASLSPGFIEELSVSLQNIDLKQAHEPETCHLMNQRKRKSCGEGLESLEKDLSSNSNPVRVSTCIVGTSRLLSLTDKRNSKPSSVSSPKKHIRDIVRTPIIVQALPCFNSSLRLRKRSKSSVTGPVVAGKRSFRGKSSKFSPKFDSASFHQRSFCNRSRAESKTLQSLPPSADSNALDVGEESQLALEHQGPTKFSTLSMEVKSAEYMNSNFRTQSSSSDGERKLEDTVRGLAWSKSKLVPKRKCGRRSESPAQVETRQSPSEDEDIKNSANDGVSNISLDCDPLPEPGEKVTSHKLVVEGGLEQKIDQKISCFEAAIDPNLCMNDDESSPTPPLSTELGLEGPVSPENKESSPPRGNSDENQVETSSELSGKEDGDVQEDLTQNAAEAMVSGEEDGDMQEELSKNAATALVSISSSVFQTCPETAACEPSEPSRSDDLYWFAKVVSSVVDDPDSELGVSLRSKNDGDYKEYMFNGLDYFEAMTLNLVESNVEEADWFKTYDQVGEKEEASGATYLPSQQSRGRMRRQRQQRKDFQTEVLPSLASLSRCEVTEDLQTIEGLIEAANGPRGRVCTRSMSRNGRARGRKRLFISTSNLTDTTICSPSKQRTSFREKDVKERSLIGWGRITRRRRGPRSPSTNPWLR